MWNIFLKIFVEYVKQKQPKIMENVSKSENNATSIVQKK